MARATMFIGTMEKDYEEYLDFDEEPQSRVFIERRASFNPQSIGFFRGAIPIMPLSLAVFCCVINFIIPGSGTFLAGISVACCSDSRGNSKLRCFYINILAASLQFLLWPLLIGFIWSSVWGVMFIQIARNWFISDLDNRTNCVSCCPCSSW